MLEINFNFEYPNYFDLSMKVHLLFLLVPGTVPLYFENFNLDSTITPVRVGELEQLLVDTKYDSGKTRFLIDGFTNGFSLEYDGP